MVNRQAGVFFQQPYRHSVFLLDIMKRIKHVVACLPAVQVRCLVDVLDVSARHLNYRENIGLVTSCNVKLAFSVTQILLVYLQEQLSTKRTQVSKLLNYLAVVLLFNGQFGIGLRIPL